MADFMIRDLSDDSYLLLQEQAKKKGISANTYIKTILQYSAIAGMPDIASLLPGTIEYTIRSILRQDNERLMAYTDAQARILQDAVRVLRTFIPEEKNAVTSDVTPDTSDVTSAVTV
jgi:hypothetical protein